MDTKRKIRRKTRRPAIASKRRALMRARRRKMAESKDVLSRVGDTITKVLNEGLKEFYESLGDADAKPRGRAMKRGKPGGCRKCRDKRKEAPMGDGDGDADDRMEKECRNKKRPAREMASRYRRAARGVAARRRMEERRRMASKRSGKIAKRRAESRRKAKTDLKASVRRARIHKIMEKVRAKREGK